MDVQVPELITNCDSIEDTNSGDYVVPLLVVSEEEARKRPPSEPPRMVITGGEDDPPIPGTLAAVTWGDLTPGLDIPIPEESIDWPAPVERRGRTTIEIPAEAGPYWFDVFITTQVDRENGMPIDPETGKEFPTVHRYQFDLGGQEDGRKRHEDGVFKIDCLPERTYPEEFISVFAAWKVYPIDAEGNLEKGIAGDVYANWIFHFVNE